MLAKLGDIVFEPKEISFNRLHRETKANWVEHKTIKGNSIVLFVGSLPRKIEVSGTILCDFHDGLSQIEKMHDLVVSGKELAFSATTKSVGTYLGMWAIVSISEERSIFDAKGRPKKIEFKLELLEISSARNKELSR